MPKGVPREVAWLIRTSSRKIAKPGQVLSLENAYKLYDALDTFRDIAAREAADALYRAEHLKSAAGRARATDRLHDLRRDAVGADEARNALDRAAGIQPLPSLAPNEAKPIVLTDEESPEWFVPEEGALEAFIGVDYTEGAGYHHRSGKKTSDVSFNAVLRWEDGTPITESDAREALQLFAQSGVLPDGMECDAVSWAGWKGKERHGSLADLENFRHILSSVGNYGVRVGLLKPDRL